MQSASRGFDPASRCKAAHNMIETHGPLSRAAPKTGSMEQIVPMVGPPRQVEEIPTVALATTATDPSGNLGSCPSVGAKGLGKLGMLTYDNHPLH